MTIGAGMDEVPEWLLFDQQDVHDTLVATSKHKPHLIADMAAMANVPGLANGQARRPVVLHTQQYASQVSHFLKLARIWVCCCQGFVAHHAGSDVVLPA